VIAVTLNASGLSVRDLAAVGIANQRETTVVWNRRSGVPDANVIVWQDTRPTSSPRPWTRAVAAR
jgi:glycerol kinase